MKKTTKKSKGQSSLGSALEALADTALGFVVSIILWQVVGTAMGYDITWGDNILLTLIFTVVSIIRKFLTRRLFNWIHLGP